jgi:hypothetical protein
VVVPVLKELPPVKSYSDIYGMNVDDADGYGKLMRDVLIDRARVLVSAYGSMEARRARLLAADRPSVLRTALSGTVSR